MPRPVSYDSRTLQRICHLVRGLRAVWSFFGITLLMVLSLELSLRLVFAAKDTFSGFEVPDPRLIAAGYDGADWARSLLRENGHRVAEWKPYVYFRQKPFRSATTTVDDQNHRRTWQPPEDSEVAESPRPRVWIFGGSAAWGVGARDGFTIPSLIAKDLSARGIAVKVTNFSEVGYVSTQEILTLVLELRAGRRPDLVVFYDGVNDVLAAYQNGRAGWPQNEANRRREFAYRRSPAHLAAASVRTWFLDSALDRLAQAIRRRLTTGWAPEPRFPPQVRDALGSRKLSESILDTYAANRRLVHALAGAYGFRSRFYWQPVLFTKKRLTPFERGEQVKYAALSPIFLYVYRQARARASRDGDDFQDASGLLDNSERLLFTDFCHTTEAANAIVAQQIAADLAPLLASRTPQIRGEGLQAIPARMDGGSSDTDEARWEPRPPDRSQKCSLNCVHWPIARPYARVHPRMD